MTETSGGISLRRIAVLLVIIGAVLYFVVPAALWQVANVDGPSPTGKHINELALTLDFYRSDFGAYPPDTMSLAGCTPERQMSETLVYHLGTVLNVNGWERGPYMEFPTRQFADTDADGFSEFVDQWGNPFLYAENASHKKPTGQNHQSFDLVSAGADGKLGGTISPETGYVRATTREGQEEERDNPCNFSLADVQLDGSAQPSTREPVPVDGAVAPSTPPSWKEVWPEYQRNERREFTRDFSDCRIVFPLKAKWKYEDPGTMQEGPYGKTFVRHIRFLGHDATAVYAGGTAGRIYKLALKDGSLLWQAKVKAGEADADATRGCIVGPYLIVIAAPLFRVSSGLHYAVIDTATGEVVRSLSGRPTGASLRDVARQLASGEDIQLPEDYVARHTKWWSAQSDLPTVATDPIGWDLEFVASLLAVRERDIYVRPDGVFFRTCWPGTRTGEHYLVKHASDCSVQWSVRHDTLRHIGALGDDDLYMIDGGMRLRCLLQTDGSERWSFSAYPDVRHGSGASSVLILGDHVVWAGMNIEMASKPLEQRSPYEITMVWLDRRTGTQMHYTRFPGLKPEGILQNAGEQVVPVRGSILIPTDKGVLYCYSSGAATPTNTTSSEP